MKDETKTFCEKIHQLMNDVQGCITSLSSSFIYLKPTYASDCQPAIEEIKKTEPELSRKITALAREDHELKSYLSVPVHLLRIAENVEKLSEFIEKKNKENVLFSDRAVTEITFLMQRLCDMLRPAAEVVLAKNIILSRYVEESEQGITRRATEYTTMHEERLIEGLCQPAASALYINIIDRIKGIAWHVREIAAKLS